MYRNTKNQPSQNRGREIDSKIALYRAHFESNGEWPEKATELLNQVIKKAQNETLSEADQEMLSLVINDALHGVDIEQQYPSFYKKLIQEAALREAFLDILDMAQDENAEPIDDPTLASAKLPFLAIPRPSATLQQLADRWRMTWNQSIAQLNAIFLTTGPEPAYRGTSDLEDPWYVLVRDQIDITDTQLKIFLEVAQQGEKPDELQLALAVNINTQPPQAWPSLTARLTWGEYAETVFIRSQERATFHPVLLSRILNEQMTSFRSDLTLTVEPAT